MKRGIIIFSYGKPCYGFMAFNLALSIKYHSPNLPIHLAYEEPSLRGLSEQQKSMFTTMQEIDMADLYDKGFNPGKPKALLHKYLPFEENIYLDADSCVLKPLEPLFDDFKAKGGSFYCMKIGQFSMTDEPRFAMDGKVQKRDFPEMMWAWPEDIWNHYKLPQNAVVPATNTSLIYLNKKGTKELYKKVKDNYIKNPIPELRMKWGGTYPDELALNIALAQMNIDPDFKIGNSEPLYLTMKQITDWELNGAYVIGLFGGVRFSHVSLLQYYDRLIHRYSKELLGINQQYKSHMLIKDKHSNRRK